MGTVVVAYLFFAGTGAGVCVIASALALLSPRSAVAVRTSAHANGGRREVIAPLSLHRELFARLYLLGLLLVSVGALCLLGDLGVTDRALLLFLSPQPTFITFGSYALAIEIGLALLLSIGWGSKTILWRYRIVWALEWLALLFGIAVALYTGLMFGDIVAVPFWSTPWLAPLFLSSALSCGCACVCLVIVLTDCGRRFSSVARRLVAFDLLLVVVEAVCAAGFIGHALSSSYDVAVQAATSLIAGAGAPLFVGGFLGAGLAVPFAFGCFDVFQKKAQLIVGPLLVSSVCGLVGGAVLRWSVIASGIHP
jgi:formate-dependent nitrite reductase membrane component NrfD